MIAVERPTIAPRSVPRLRGGVFRANASYRLTAHAELGEQERAWFDGLAQNADHFGLLIPVDTPELGVKAIDHDVARLFTDTARPTTLTEERLSLNGSRADLRLAGLVLDGILEMQGAQGFVTGPAACPSLSPTSDSSACGSALARLSRDALALAMHVPVDEPARLSAWIYAYNAIPCGPTWLRRFGLTDRLQQVLGLNSEGANHRRLSADFVRVPHDAWQMWQRRGTDPSADHLAYKLYISPHPKALIAAFDQIITTLVASDVTAFKLGRGLAGLLRPDKLVVYLDSWAQLQRLATDLQRALDGVASHGVPFTAALTDDGLLSWGMDPPPHVRLPGWGQVESWRLWLTNRLSRALLYARLTTADATEAIAYASVRLGVEGIDTSHWAPADTLWEASP